jgi:hypothetical protein
VGFAWEVLFLWALGGGCADRLICGDEASMRWVG